MTLKKKVEKLEKMIGIESDLEGARGFVMFGLQFGIIPETIDVEEMVRTCALQGISLGKIIDGIYRKNSGLPKLPSEEED